MAYHVKSVPKINSNVRKDYMAEIGFYPVTRRNTEVTSARDNTNSCGRDAGRKDTLVK